MVLLKEVNEVVYKIIGSCMEVHRILGPGLDVELYRKALEVEMQEKGLEFESEKSLEVFYKDVLVGTLDIEFLVNNSIVVVLRSQKELFDIEIQQVLRCLPLTESTMGLLVNFGNIKTQYKRILPSRQVRETRKESFRASANREIGKTREGNPII
jgi:GxxExxY protein